MERADQALIDASLKILKESLIVKKMFDEADVPLELLDFVTIVFERLDVSARTDKGIIYLNEDLKDSPEDIEHYLVHELTHFLQQCFSDGPTKGSSGDDYLENPYEVEGFQNQTEYIAHTEGEETAEDYIEKVLQHHSVDGDDREEKKEELMAKAEDKEKAQLAFTFKKDPLPEVTQQDREEFLKLLEEGNLPSKVKPRLHKKLPDFERRYRKRMIETLLDSIKEPDFAKKAGLFKPNASFLREVQSWVEKETLARIHQNLADKLLFGGSEVEDLRNIIKSISPYWTGQDIDISSELLPQSLKESFSIKKHPNGFEVRHDNFKEVLSFDNTKSWYRSKIIPYRRELVKFINQHLKSDYYSLQDLLEELRAEFGELPKSYTGTFSSTERKFETEDSVGSLLVTLWFNTQFNSYDSRATLEWRGVEENKKTCWMNVRIDIPKEATASKYKILVSYTNDCVRHEVLHFEQNIYGVGYPSRKVLDQEAYRFNPYPAKPEETEDESSEEEDLEEEGDDSLQEPQETSRLFSKKTNLQEGEEESYFLDDIEFYPNLIDSIDEFNIKAADLSPEEKKQFIRFFVGMSNNYQGEDRPDDFFITLRDHNEGKYRKALKEFFKAVSIPQ